MRTVHRAFFSSFLAALFVASLSPAGAQTAAFRRLAPADEYFGPLKRSVLGIRNTLREQSVRDCEKKYPAYPWLPRSVFDLQHLYAQIPSETSRRHAAEVATWLISRYPGSMEAAQMRLELPPTPARAP